MEPPGCPSSGILRRMRANAGDLDKVSQRGQTSLSLWSWGRVPAWPGGHPSLKCLVSAVATAAAHRLGAGLGSAHVAVGVVRNAGEPLGKRMRHLGAGKGMREGEIPWGSSGNVFPTGCAQPRRGRRASRPAHGPRFSAGGRAEGLTVLGWGQERGPRIPTSGSRESSPVCRVPAANTAASPEGSRSSDPTGQR